MLPSLRHLPHFDLLNADDQWVYEHISATLSAPSSKNKRNKRMDDFRDILDAIELFENADKANKWKRCLVCGICRIPHGIAVNVSQLKKLICKCKSSINGSLRGLGYGVVLPKTASCKDLLEAIPTLRVNAMELRKWTVRMKAGYSLPEESTSPETPGIDLGMADMFARLDTEREWLDL
jgi:hypothetical protein